MDRLHSPLTFGHRDRVTATTPPSYWYTGRCPQTGALLRLPRTAAVEAIAGGLMQQLAAAPAYQQEGKMYGVLLVQTAAGELAVLKGFSGYLNGKGQVAGWVPPIPGRTQVALAEAHTLEQLAHLKEELMRLQQLPARATYQQLSQHYEAQLNALAVTHRQRKEARDRQRQQYHTQLTGASLELALAELIKQSQQDGLARRRLKRKRDEALAPFAAAIAQADQRMQVLKRDRKALSRQLQAQMHAVYSLTNFAGISTTLQTLMPEGLPTGTGDCAAPKLLHYAATHQLTPLAMAEFWWGPPSSDKLPGHFYGACQERCQPIMGFLLSGMPSPAVPEVALTLPIPILYRDEALIVVDKPTGLLSVPGRRSNLQDSVLSRLRCQLPEHSFLKAVHRLDKGTSGVLVLAASPAAHAALSQQFAQRQVSKTYEAILSKPVARATGTIELPLWRDPRDRPKQSVHWERGKPSLTQFEVLQFGTQPRVKFLPHTGRTHQLRVHAADPQGLNAPILGDALYGEGNTAARLHLHATSLQLTHPSHHGHLHFSSTAPF
ncbi:MAG: RluA family pseudouridine synthase [Cyanobacteria bacterium J06638_28]